MATYAEYRKNVHDDQVFEDPELANLPAIMAKAHTREARELRAAWFELQEQTDKLQHGAGTAARTAFLASFFDVGQNLTPEDILSRYDHINHILEHWNDDPAPDGKYSVDRAMQRLAHNIKDYEEAFRRIKEQVPGASLAFRLAVAESMVVSLSGEMDTLAPADNVNLESAMPGNE